MDFTNESSKTMSVEIRLSKREAFLLKTVLEEKKTEANNEAAKESEDSSSFQQVSIECESILQSLRSEISSRYGKYQWDRIDKGILF